MHVWLLRGPAMTIGPDARLHARPAFLSLERTIPHHGRTLDLV